MPLGTMRPLASFLAFYHRAGRLEQWDHSRNPSRCFFLSGWSLGTIRPLTKLFSRFILHRASHLEKWDHSRNPSRCFFLSGWSPETIRPLTKPFSRFILHRAGRLEQLDHLKKTKKKINKKNREKRKTGRVFTIILLYKTYYTKSKENKFSNAFIP